MGDESKTPEPIPGKAVAVVALLLVVAYGAYALTGSANGDSPSRSGISEGEAWDICKRAVTQEIRNPATADFDILATDIAEKGDGWSIAGSLSADNDFGVEQEIGFSCQIDADGKVETTVS